MIDALIDALVRQITPDTIATMLIFTLVGRAAWRLMDILMDGLEAWMRNQLSSDDSQD